MIGELSYKRGADQPNEDLSDYQPPADIVQLTSRVRGAYEKGQEIQNKPFPELNNKSPQQRAEEDRMQWLSWTPEPYEGEDDWRWNGVRPITRNRVISVAAHLTSQLLIPNVSAQNEFDKEDKSAANVMRDMIEYNIRNSNYETAFLFGVISGLVNPVTYFQVDYTLSWQEVWEGNTLKRKVDDVFSGFQNELRRLEDVFIDNPYEFSIQRQDWIIEKDLVSYGTVEAEYGEHEHFRYVQPGKKTILHDDGNFYDVEDQHGDMVEKVVYKSRRSDEEIPFIGGVYMGTPNPDYNPITHRTNKNKPKYNMVKFGYEPIDEMSFHYYKSLVAKMQNDQQAADRQWQMYFDASYLSTFPPTVTMGAGKLDKSVVTPGMNTNIPSDSNIEFLDSANPEVALQALREAERSLEESSVSTQAMGIGQEGDQTARESVILEQNRQTQLGISARMIGVMVRNIGDLYVDDIIRYQTVGELEEVTGEMTYQTFILDGKVKGGKEKTSYIKFTDRFAGQDMSEERKRKEELALYEEAEDDQDIYEVNPLAFAKMDYMVRIDAEEAIRRDDAFERTFKIQTYDRAVRDPLVQQDPEAHRKILRDFLFEPLMKGEASNYMPDISRVAQTVVPGGAPEGETGDQPQGGGQGEDLADRLMRSATNERLQV